MTISEGQLQSRLRKYRGAVLRWRHIDARSFSLDLKAENPAVAAALLKEWSGRAELIALAIGTPFPATWAELQDSPLAAPASLDAELRWNAIVTRSLAPQINSFLKHREAFASKIARDEIQSASAELDDLQSEVGVSLWLASARFLVAAMRSAKPYPAVEAFNALNQQVRDPLSRAILYFCSVVHERHLTPSAIEAKYSDALSGVSRDDAPTNRLLSHIRMRASFQVQRRFDDEILAFDLAQSSRYSAIDRYVCFVRALQTLMSRSHAPREDISSIAKRLQEKMRDRTLCAIARYEGSLILDADAERFACLIDAADAYTLGYYTDAATLAKRLIELHPTGLEGYELLASSLARSGASMDSVGAMSRFAHGLVSDLLAAIVAAGTDAETRWQRIIGHALRYDSLTLGLQLRAVQLSRPGATGDEFVSPGLRLVSATLPSPRLVMSLSKREAGDRFLAALESRAGKRVSISLFRAYAGGTFDDAQRTLVGLPEARRTKYSALAALESRNFHEAVELFTELWRSASSQVEAEKAFLQLLDALLRAGNIHEALRLAASSVADASRVIPYGLLRAIADAGEMFAGPSEPAGIEMPIVRYALYKVTAAVGDAAKVYESLDEFLRSVGAGKPSELRKVSASVENLHLVFLLRNVCVPQFLDTSTAYASTRELENERIAVLRLLESLDGGNHEIYAAERDQIALQQVIREALKEVDSSKIYVDTASIREELSKVFHDEAARFLVYRSVGDELDGVTMFIASIDGAGQLKVDSKPSTETALSRIYRTPFEEVRTRFLWSNEHGLDSFLSVQVRHGTLEGQLRSPFERTGLVTRKQGGKYSKNDRWRTHLLEVGAAAMQSRVEDALESLSTRVDEEIAYLKQDAIQINSKNCPKGLFDYEYDAIDLVAAMERSRAATTVDEVIDAMFEELWERTRANLDVVRAELRERCAVRFRRYVTECKAAVQAAAPEAWQLLRAIETCTTELEEEIANVAEWFTVRRASAMRDYTIGIAIETAVEMLRRTSALFGLQVPTRLESQVKLRGATFQHVVNALFILLHNAVEHAPSKLDTIRIAAREHGDSIELSVRNEVEAGVQVEPLRARAHELEERAGAGGGRHAVRSEGGSGYPKLGKILRYDLRCARYEVKVSVSPERVFEARISVPLAALRP